MVSDGIGDVYDAGVASVPTPTSITPSNASPVTLTANTAVKPTAAGYAIEFYRSFTPSNNTPIGLTIGDICKINGNGYAIASYSSVTPSNSTPVTLSSGSIYKMSGPGKAVQSVTSKTPSDSNPPSVASGDIVKMGGAGHLVSSLPINLLAPDKYWQGNISGSGSQSITVTQKPRYVIFTIAQYGANNGYSGTFIFDAQNITGIYYRYQSSGYTNGSLDDASGWLTSVTASSITVKNNMSSTVRGTVIIYY
jgi:hypothetical protein